MPHHPHPANDEIWAVEGRFQHLIYSPRGGVEGLLIDTDGIPTQFVVEPQDADAIATLLSLRGQPLLAVEGRLAPPSPKGEGEHVVYFFERLAAIDGQPQELPLQDARTQGKVVRFNHARHGAANGVVLDNGDFVHTRPQGLAPLQLKIGDTVQAQGPARPLITGGGRVIEAHSVNGHAMPVAR